MNEVDLEALSFGSLSHVDISGTDIELFKAGSGPDLLFLHGMDGIEGAAALLKTLSGKYSVYAPSHPGFGASALPDGCTGIDDVAYFYLDLIDALGLDKPVIVGISFGGWVAAEILTKNPMVGSRLVLGSPLGIRSGTRRRQDVTDIFVLPRAEAEKKMQVGQPAIPADLSTLSEDRIKRIMRNTEALSLFGWSPYLNNPKLAQRMHRISLPTLVLWGDKDEILGSAYRATYTAALPAAKTETVANAGHRLHADQTESVADLVTDFASR